MKISFLVLLFVLHSFLFYSQEMKHTLNWGVDTLEVYNTNLTICDNFQFDYKNPIISFVLNNSNVDEVILLDYEFEKIPENENVIFKNKNIKVDSIVSLKLLNSFENNVNTKFLLGTPYFILKNQYYRVTTFNYKLISHNNSKIFFSKRKTNAINSVLSDTESSWHKFHVREPGFYKISYQQLVSLGFNPKLSGFDYFHIYGNSYGRLPEKNSDYKDVDLIQNSVFYIGADDGSFDQDDAIVFYSPGPNSIDFDVADSVFRRDLNIYSDHAFYFLRGSNKISPKLISKIDNTIDNPQNESSGIDLYEIHELEDTNLVFGGKRWYGEVFDFVKKFDFKFNRFNSELSDLIINISGATNARSNGSKIIVYLDGTSIGSLELGAVSSEYIRIEKIFKINSHKGFSTLTLELVRSNLDTKFFLDKIEINAHQKSTLNYSDFISNKGMIGKGYFKQYISNLSIDNKLFDITNPTELKEHKIFVSENNKAFIIDSMFQRLKRYAVCSQAIIKNIESSFTSVSSQNLHNVDNVDMIIVSPLTFLNQANALKEVHEEEGLRVTVVTDEAIYNEFSSGAMDPTAIKQFARLVYNKQLNNSKNRLKYLLLFGDGSFDYKNRIKGNNNFIPTYQFDESEDFLSAMVSDDYFGMMDDNESIKGSDLLDIAVGRLLISSEEQAVDMVNKIKSYINFGTDKTDWLSKITMIADDQEGGYFILNDTEVQSKYLKNSHPEMNVVKLYADAFQQVTTAGGERFPMLNKMIDDQFFNGSLVISYVGHGGPSGAGEERFLSIAQISNYKNINRLPLFMSSTCEFTKYDDPTRISAGEVMFLNPKGGAIALMTTTRPVFFGVNTISGNAFYKNVLQIDSVNNQSLTFGEIFRRTKNQSGVSSNRRSFTLIGDPALKINYANNKIFIDSINGKPLIKHNDTLKALSKVKFSGYLIDRNGVKINKSGKSIISVYDKSIETSTLGQNTDSPKIKFETQNSLLFKGESKITEGKFNIEFILPKDIDYKVGYGRISIVGFTDNQAGIGYSDSVLIGSINSLPINDSVGPEIFLSFDSLKQVNSGIVAKSPLLYVKLIDESGINISSSGIGHQISLILDDGESYDLNSFYISEPNNYRSGKIIFPMSSLKEGKHKIKLKVWDVFNNSSEKVLEFSVSDKTESSILKVFNYPNPFTTKTDFYIEQLGLDNDVKLKLEVFTISGKLVREVFIDKINYRSTIEKVYEWDGKDQYGDRLARGVYIYKISGFKENVINSSKLEKLVIF